MAPLPYLIADTFRVLLALLVAIVHAVAAAATDGHRVHVNDDGDGAHDDDDDAIEPIPLHVFQQFQPFLLSMLQPFNYSIVVVIVSKCVIYFVQLFGNTMIQWCNILYTATVSYNMLVFLVVLLTKARR